MKLKAKLKALSAALLSAVVANTAFASPPAVSDENATPATPPAPPVAETAEKEEQRPFFNKTEAGYDLVFNDQHYRLLEAEVRGETVKFRAFERIVYVKNPIEPDYQTLNLYVPEAYYHDGEINGYTSQTAPIFLPNAVGGYLPAKAAEYDKTRRGGESAILFALAKGYVVASVGARGRSLEKEGKYTGKAPAVIIDLKSAVRYLHANDDNIPGDAEKIISNGTSAGGAVSALLGASADHFDYQPYFKAVGALNASDKIFAVSAYCPITNLENADIAYEWEFNGLNEYSRIKMGGLNAQGFNDRTKPREKTEGTLNDAEINLSNALAARFPTYLNSLKLTDSEGNPLMLDAKGNGSFKDYLADVVRRSANKAYQEAEENSDLRKILAETEWLTVENGEISGLDWFGYVFSAKRMKSPPAFDALDGSSPENNLFGTENENNRHFTLFSAEHSGESEIGLASPQIVKQMNAMHYVDNPNAAEHWRIRVGSADRDTSHAISAILALKLQMAGKNVDYEIAWGVPHSGDYDLDDLFEWADAIVKAKNENNETKTE